MSNQSLFRRFGDAHSEADAYVKLWITPYMIEQFCAEKWGGVDPETVRSWLDSNADRLQTALEGIMESLLLMELAPPVPFVPPSRAQRETRKQTMFCQTKEPAAFSEPRAIELMLKIGVQFTQSSEGFGFFGPARANDEFGLQIKGHNYRTKRRAAQSAMNIYFPECDWDQERETYFEYVSKEIEIWNRQTKATAILDHDKKPTALQVCEILDIEILPEEDGQAYIWRTSNGQFGGFYERPEDAADSALAYFFGGPEWGDYKGDLTFEQWVLVHANKDCLKTKSGSAPTAPITELSALVHKAGGTIKHDARTNLWSWASSGGMGGINFVNERNAAEAALNAMFPVNEWRGNVEAGTTLLGYEDWRRKMIEERV